MMEEFTNNSLRKHYKNSDMMYDNKKIYIEKNLR